MRYLLGLHYYHAFNDGTNLFGISFGICAGKRNYLSATLSHDGDTPRKDLPESLTSVATYEKMTRGFYVGLFYNLSRL